MRGGCISMHHFTHYRPVLTQESALFMDQASSILRTLSKVVYSFSDEKQQLAARKMLQKTHRPQHSSTSLRKHDSVTHNSPVTSNKQHFTFSVLRSTAAVLFTANHSEEISAFICVFVAIFGSSFSI